MLDRRLVLDPQVALRREPFGALAYHYGNRKLIFLKHPDLVRVVEALPEHDTVADALVASGISQSRWPSFVAGLQSLQRAGMVRSERASLRASEPSSTVFGSLAHRRGTDASQTVRVRQ